MKVGFAISGYFCYAYRYSLISGLSLSVYAQVGLVLLIALAAKNAILIIEFSQNKLNNDNASIEDAAVQGGSARFRMTSGSFILGILPLVFASGAGAVGLKTLGVTLLGGLLSVLLIGSFFVPGYFALIHKMKARRSKKNLPNNKLSKNTLRESKCNEISLAEKKQMKSWLKQIAIFGVIFLIMSFAVDTWRTKDIDRQALPELQGLTINNETIDLKALSFEQPVLVYFWGTWCPVCSVVSSSVDTLSQYYPVYSIVMQSGDNETLKTYMATEEYQFKVINDDNNDIARSLGVQVTPLVMVIDQGELVSYTTGYVSLFGLWWRIAWASW